MTNNTSDDLQHLPEPLSPSIFVPPQSKNQSPVVDLECEDVIDTQSNEIAHAIGSRPTNLRLVSRSSPEGAPSGIMEFAHTSASSSLGNDERSHQRSRDQDDENLPENVPGKKLQSRIDSGYSNSTLERSSIPSDTALGPFAQSSCNVVTRSKLNQQRRNTISATTEVICIESNPNQLSDPLHAPSGGNQAREIRARNNDEKESADCDGELRLSQPTTRRRLLSRSEPHFNQAQVESDRCRRNIKRSNSTLSQQAKRSTPRVDLIDLDDDTMASPEQKWKGSETGARKLKDSGAPRRSQRKNSRGSSHVPNASSEINLTQNETSRELVNLDDNAVNMSYSGPTHLIFMYPSKERGSIKVTAEERERLDTRKYLNDSVIDFYIKYLEMCCQKRHKALTKSCLFLNSFFFGRMTQTRPIDYNGVKSWTKNIDLFETKFVFVPICDSLHWSLIIIVNLDNLGQSMNLRDPNTKVTARDVPRIIYFDSLDPERGIEFGTKICTYLSEEWYERKEEMKTPERKKQISNLISKRVKTRKPVIPVQSNEHDCGLYLLMCLSMFLDNKNNFYENVMGGELNLKEAFSHTEVEILRREIMVLMDRLEENWKRKDEESDSNEQAGSNKGIPNHLSEEKASEIKFLTSEKKGNNLISQTLEVAHGEISGQETNNVKKNVKLTKIEENADFSSIVCKTTGIEKHDVMMKESDVNKKDTTEPTPKISKEASLVSGALDNEAVIFEQNAKKARNFHSQRLGTAVVEDVNAGKQSAQNQHERHGKVMELTENIEGQCNPPCAQRSPDQLRCSQSISDDEVIDVENQSVNRRESRLQQLARIVREGESEDTSVIDDDEDFIRSYVPEQHIPPINSKVTNLGLGEAAKSDEGHDIPINKILSSNKPVAHAARASEDIEMLQCEPLERGDVQQQKKITVRSVNVITEVEDHMIIETNSTSQSIQSDGNGQMPFFNPEELLFDQNEHNMLNEFTES